MGLSSEVTLHAGNSPAAAGGATATTAVAGFKDCSAITIIATVAGGAGGVLDIYIQDSSDGVKFYDYWHITQRTAGQAAETLAYDPSPNDSVTTIGFDLTPALANGAVRGGHWFDQLRVLYVPGAGVAAAAQNIRVLAVR